MNRPLYFTVPLICIAVSVSAFAQNGSFLEPLQKRDSVLVADQLRYGFRIEGVQEGTEFAFPDYSKGFRDSVEVLSPWKVDTLDVRKGRKGKPSLFDIEGSVVITSFDEGEYSLPPISVLRRLPDGKTDTLDFESRTLSVMTIPVDTATFELHDIKGQIRYPLTFAELVPYTGGIQLIATLVILAAALFIMRRQKDSDGGVRREPPHIAALRKLDSLRGNRLWAADKQKIFYSGVTDTLREYIVSRYGISAMEMTTKEIFDSLSDMDVPENLYCEIRSLFERADFVKFAKYVASEEENASAVPSAVQFVTATYQSELDAEAGNEGEDSTRAETQAAGEDMANEK